MIQLLSYLSSRYIIVPSLQYALMRRSCVKRAALSASDTPALHDEPKVHYTCTVDDRIYNSVTVKNAVGDYRSGPRECVYSYKF